MRAVVEGVARFAARGLLDEDGRPCAELASPHYDPARTEVVACPYAGARHGLPMNRSAQKLVATVWPEVLAAARALAGPDPTVHAAFRAAVAGVTGPLLCPGPAPRWVSAWFKTSLGYSQILSSLLLADDGVADAPLASLGDARELLAHLDRDRWLVGQVHVCAGPDAMIGQMFDALAQGAAGPAPPPFHDPAPIDAALTTIAVQTARLGALVEAADRHPVADRLGGEPAPWLRAVLAVPDRRAAHARRLFPVGGVPAPVEHVIAADRHPVAIDAATAAAFAAIGKPQPP